MEPRRARGARRGMFVTPLLCSAPDGPASVHGRGSMANEEQALSATALREWTTHVESIMRGLAHALNNRAAALSAIIELSREPDDDPDATRQILSAELSRVRELADVVRALGPGRGEAEALIPGELTSHVLTLLRLHADQRERNVEIDGAAAPPIRAPRWMMQRALLVLCASSPTTDPAARTLRAELVAEGDWMVARVLMPPDGSAVESVYVAEMARAIGGEPLRGGFRVPTLASIRRREGR